MIDALCIISSLWIYHLKKKYVGKFEYNVELY